MTGREDLAEFVTAYVAEVDEYLASANAHLLAVDAALRRGETNARGVRETFRALHTIKGLSAMVGVEPVVAVAHRMEALLRSASASNMRLPPDAIDVLLRGMRAIEQRVRAFAEGREITEPPAELLQALDALDAERASLAAQAPAELELEPTLLAKLAPFEIEHLQQGLRAGKRAFRADFAPSPERAARGLTINSVRDALGRLGEIVKVLPVSVPASAAAPGGLCFAILLVTGADAASVAAAVGAEPGGVELLAEGHAEEAPGSVAPGVPDDTLDDLAVAGEVQKRSFVRVDVARLDDAVDRLSALIVTRFRLMREVNVLTRAGVNTRELLHIMNENARQLRDLRGAILRVRMVPVTELLDRIPLLVRGLRRATQRLVRVELDAGGAELDKTVAERLFPALVHLVRNAVDHALEDPDERVRRGKPEEGLLRIHCASESNTRLVLSVTDDGRGIDAAQVARKAQAPLPESDAELLELLCRPGLSTRDVATTTSGRGMGMEIVKRVAVAELGGELTLKTERGVGSTFTLRVPLTISIVEAFSCECEGQRFVVPVAVVEEILEVDAGSVVRGPKSGARGPAVGMLRRRGEVLPLLPLARLFGLSDHERPGQKALVVRRGNQVVAFGVDRMLGQQEVVVRPLDDDLVRVPGVAGATDLGDGLPTLVLDLLALGASLAYSAKELPA